MPDSAAGLRRGLGGRLCGRGEEEELEVDYFGDGKEELLGLGDVGMYELLLEEMIKILWNGRHGRTTLRKGQKVR
jgi:hypothetical protein